MWALPQSRIWTCQKTACSYREHVVRSETEVAMRGYGQFCPVAKGAEVFAERWTPLVLRELLCGSTHFSDLHRGVPLMSRSLLSLRLKQLEQIDVVERKQGPHGPEYHLTQAGREFAPMIRQLGEWGQRWFRSKFGREELDVTLLMWDMRRCIKAHEFPPGRICVRFGFTDLPASKRSWWLVSDGEEIDLCPADPGFEVGLYVTTDLHTMTRVFMGDLAMKSAIASGRIELDGTRELRQRLERWLGLSGFAGIGDARRPTHARRNRDRSDRRHNMHLV
jgi:DNA-binding HxlR family transcriptional regulator